MKTINAINAFSGFISTELAHARQHPNAAWMKRQERRKSRRVQEAELSQHCYDGIQQEALEFTSVVPAAKENHEVLSTGVYEPLFPRKESMAMKAVTVIRKRLSQRRVVETIMVPA